jgi:uncharacterized protein (DUF488 family)
MLASRVPFFTVGHSNRSLPAFADLLAGCGVELVADVRTVPRSRANPQFNGDALPASLSRFGLRYEHLPELGGLRGRQPASAASPNTLWSNPSFRNYADYALTEPFRRGLERLRRLGRSRCAIMCAEAVWWRCHRRIIADYLLASGETVFHIMGPGRADPAKLTPGAVLRADGSVVYPAPEPQGAFDTVHPGPPSPG